MIQRYVMVGAGGTGTHLLHPLINYLNSFHRADDYELGILDGDQVEEKNLVRQLFDSSQIKVNKATAAVTPFKHLQNVRAIPEYLGKDNISRYITDGAIVLIAVDNFPVRFRIEQHCLTLNNVIVINGGNEEDNGSCQIWIRKDGKNITPPISFLHPEISSSGVDRAELSCQEVAELPGGEQLIITNMSSAMWMLTALMDYHRERIPWTELHFDLASGNTIAIDNRDKRGWVQ
jgi:molybdopterin/thiamine biosynthesis adenylyltransferase